MNESLPSSIADALGSGLPVLLLQFVICIVLLVVGVMIYTMVTPFHERELLRQGNVAAATVLSGASGRACHPAGGTARDHADSARHPGMGYCGDPATIGHRGDCLPRDARVAPQD